MRPHCTPLVGPTLQRVQGLETVVDSVDTPKSTLTLCENLEKIVIKHTRLGTLGGSYPYSTPSQVHDSLLPLQVGQTRRPRCSPSHIVYGGRGSDHGGLLTLAGGA
jgi:hypothetical protein